MTDDVLGYDHHLRTEPVENLTPIEVDPLTGFRFTYRNIGMTRNAKEENTKEFKVILDPIPHVIIDTKVPLRGWYKPKHEKKGARPRPCYTEALLSQPYGGHCDVGCTFCYINSGVRGYRSAGVTTVDLNYGVKIREQIRGMRTGAAVYMSSFIDPFIELEEIYGNTRACSEAATDAGLPIFFLTRKKVPDWAYDELKKNKHSYMQFSINTPNPDDWRRISPKAETLEFQLEQVREMKRQGIYVSIQVNPIIAGPVTNEDILELIHILKEAGADHLIFKFVEITYPTVKGMIKNMQRSFGKERAKSFEALFTQNIGGMRTIDEDYRKAALDLYSAECKKVGITMSLCYEYEYERDAAGEIVSKTGISMGSRYITSDQCHGHKVPVYSRESENELFMPIDECPPSGCLTCGDTLKPSELPPCGNPNLAMAGALTHTDLKKVAKRPDNLIFMG